jgi:hypothetical protein
MKMTDYIAANDYTDSKGYELVVRVMADGFSFAWYRYADTKKQVSDSQFDCGTIDPDNAEEIIKDKFNCYYVGIA